MTMHTRRNIIRLGGTLAASLITPGIIARDSWAAGPTTGIGVVTAITGQASALLESKERQLKTSEAVFERDLVRTEANSRLGLRLGASTVVNLGPSTKLRIDKHLIDAGGEFELVDGAVLYERRKGGQGSDKTTLRSAYGLIAVRGTKFFAGPSNGVFGVFVEHGAVDVTGAGKTVRVPPGFGTDIARPGAPPSDPNRWRPARVRAALLATTGRV